MYLDMVFEPTYSMFKTELVRVLCIHIVTSHDGTVERRKIEVYLFTVYLCSSSLVTLVELIFFSYNSYIILLTKVLLH